MKITHATLFFAAIGFIGIPHVTFAQYVPVPLTAEQMTYASGGLLNTPPSGGSSGTVPMCIIGSTNGVISNPSPIANTETWVGYNAGVNASNNHTVMIGNDAGNGATNATNASMIGTFAGNNATNAQSSNFMGSYAGHNATNASYANFFGVDAGSDATNADHANFIGDDTGDSATNAAYANFIGYMAGLGAQNAPQSNFIGSNAGDSATNAHHSNFFGQRAGFHAPNAFNSIFVGSEAGSFALHANNAIFIGDHAGSTDAVDNSNNNGSSILIGANTTTGGFSNSIAVGTSAQNTAQNQLMIGSASSPINQISMISSAGASCSITPTGVACSSDENLKNNITSLPETTLDTLMKVKTVTYTWKKGLDTNRHIGFIAQDLQKSYPELVDVNDTGFLRVNYAGITPVIVKSIQQLKQQVDVLNTKAGVIVSGAVTKVKSLFVDDIHAKTLCLGDTCVTEAQLKQLLQNQTNVK